jgi:hypothetical protein
MIIISISILAYVNNLLAFDKKQAAQKIPSFNGIFSMKTYILLF